MIKKENETKKENKKESEKGCVPVNHWVDWSKKKYWIDEIWRQLVKMRFLFTFTKEEKRTMERKSNKS